MVIQSAIAFDQWKDHARWAPLYVYSASRAETDACTKDKPVPTQAHKGWLTILLTGRWEKPDSEFVLVEGTIHVGADGSGEGVFVWRNVRSTGMRDGLINKEFVHGVVGSTLSLVGTRVEPAFLKPDAYEIRLWGGEADSGFYSGRSRAAHGCSRWDATMSGTYRVKRHGE